VRWRHRWRGGETRRQRADLIAQLDSLEPYPESVRINSLVQDQGTPLAGIVPLDPLALIRRIAIARITMPRAAGAPGHALLNRVGPRV